MRAFPSVLLSCLLVAAAGPALADTPAFDPHALPVPQALAAKAAASDGAADLRFGDIFKRPIGPKGLEPSARLLALDGQRVRIAGFMVARETAMPGQFILSPLPVLLGDEDESLADDLPPSAVFVLLPPSLKNETVPNLHGLMQLTGTLRAGPREEADGRVSAVRLELDDSSARWLPLAPPAVAAR